MTQQPGISSPERNQRKKELRKRIIEERDKLTAEERESKSAIICSKLQHLLEKQLSKSRIHSGQHAAVLSYLPFRSEVDVLPFLNWCWEEGFIVAVPRTLPQERRMIFHRIRSLEDTRVTTPYGIREPHPHLAEMNDPSSIVLILVPGVVFDPSGRRIGYGGGYYDRYLADLAGSVQDGGAGIKKLPLLAAPCFDLQIAMNVPAEPHDIPMDIILTEHREIVVRDWC